MRDMIACSKCGWPFHQTAKQVEKQDKVCRACKNKYYRLWYARQVGNTSEAAFTPLHQQGDATKASRAAVRRRTGYAIKKGKLIRQPCEVCGDLKSEAHHDDYSKPLIVRWLCKDHHEEWHTNHPDSPN